MTAIQIFDRELAKERRDRAAPAFASYRFLHDWAEKDLVERLNLVRRDFPKSVILGDRCSDDFKNKIAKQKNISDLSSVTDSAEIIPLEETSADMILSIHDLHTVNDLPGLLIQIRRSLRADGLFLASLPGGETLHELRTCLMDAELEISGGASPRVSPFIDKQQAGALLQRAGFSLPVVDSDILTVEYRDIFHLMQDIKGMGESNVIRDRRKTFTPRSMFLRAAEIYAQRHQTTAGKITASFEIISLIGWAPHASQQQALKRGSGQVNLAEILS